MKIVNIKDIESLIEAKLEIDKILIAHKEIKEKMSLEEYMKKYCVLNKCSYICNSTVIPFEYKNIYGLEYFVIGEDEHVENIINKLSKINFDYTKLNKNNIFEIAEKNKNNNNQEYLIIDNNYYTFT